MINHIEYAAANYGEDYVNSKAPISIQQQLLNQFLIFNKTLERLRSSYGNRGVVYLNDFRKDNLEYMLEKIQRDYRELCKGIEFKLLPGNLYEIDLPETETAHLKFLPHIVASDKFVKNVHRFVKTSKIGLEFTDEIHIVERFEEFFKLENRRKYLPKIDPFTIQEIGIDIYRHNPYWGELEGPSKTILLTPRAYFSRI